MWQVLKCCSVTRSWLFVTPWTAAHQASLSLTISWSLPKFMSIVSVMPSNHLSLCLPLLLLPSAFPSIRVFSSESALHIRWPKYWSFSTSPSNEVWFPLRLSGFISLLSKGLARVFSRTTVWNHKFFSSSLLSLLYGPALTSILDYWKDHSLDYTDFGWQSDVFAFYTLSRFVIAFLPRSSCFLVSWLQSPSAVILEPKKRKSDTASTFLPSICYEVIVPDTMILVFWILNFNQLFHPPLSPSSRCSLVPLCSLPLAWYHLHTWVGWYFSRQSWFQLANSSSLTFYMMCFTYTLNKHGDSNQACSTPFSILNQSVVLNKVLIVAFWPEYRLIRSQVRGCGIPISLRVFHGLLWSTQSKTLV